MLAQPLLFPALVRPCALFLVEYISLQKSGGLLLEFWAVSSWVWYVPFQHSLFCEQALSSGAGLILV